MVPQEGVRFVGVLGVDGEGVEGGVERLKLRGDGGGGVLVLFWVGVMVGGVTDDGGGEEISLLGTRFGGVEDEVTVSSRHVRSRLVTAECSGNG